MVHLNYKNLISIENLFQAWNEFKKGKRNKKDVQVFERNLEDNLFDLSLKLENRTYSHSFYQDFYVNDPKRRHIHKANVSDRIVHHLLYKYLYEVFDRTFIYDSYSCRLGKGTHKGVKRLSGFARKVSKNYNRNCWALKCDIKKFFASVDHRILINILSKKIENESILGLLTNTIRSFNSDYGQRKGIPLGNLTSQIFANIYLDRLDQFVKHKLKTKYYLRYADDFVFLSTDKNKLLEFIDPIREFLLEELKLELHPEKVIVRKLDWGIDFLGYIVLPHYVLPRTKTKQRLLWKVNSKNIQSYLGYLGHASAHKLAEAVKNKIWLWSKEDF
ncbi:MAG: reverse transcriptase/maturase family protein [Patescibacteria group bacterium]